MSINMNATNRGLDSIHVHVNDSSQMNEWNQYNDHTANVNANMIYAGNNNGNGVVADSTYNAPLAAAASSSFSSTSNGTVFPIIPTTAGYSSTQAPAAASQLSPSTTTTPTILTA